MQLVSRLVPTGTALLALTLLVGSAVLAQNQTPPSSTGGASNASAQATGQGSANAGRTGASAQGSAAASAQAAGTSSTTGQSAATKSTTSQSGTASSKAPPSATASDSLASGSSVNAVLTKPVDSKRDKPGDPVTARTTQPTKTQSGASIPKDSTLMGHVTQVQGRDESHSSSSLGIVFDKATTRDGRSIPLSNVAIQSVAAAEASAAGNAGDMGMMGPSGAMGDNRGAGGGGLVGRTTGSVGGAVGSTAGGVVHGSESVAGAASGMLQASPGAAGRVGATGLLESQSHGVFGLQGLSLSSEATDAATGSVVTSSGKSVHLDQGTRLLLTSSSGSAASSAPQTTKGATGPGGQKPPPTEKPKP